MACNDPHLDHADCIFHTGSYGLLGLGAGLLFLIHFVAGGCDISHSTLSHYLFIFSERS